MRDNISPEEKLLKLIRGQRKRGASPEKKSATGEGPEFVRLKFPNIAIQDYFSPANISKLIWIVFIISCLYLAYSFVSPLPRQDIQLPKPTAETMVEKEAGPIQQAKPYEFYSQGIKERNIFGSTSQESEKPIGAINSDLLKDLSLVGIIAGDNPQAVIEDKKSQKIYYVTKGQSIGEFVVLDIQDGKIILNYNGQKFELYL